MRKKTQIISGLKLLNTVVYAADIALLTIRAEIMQHVVDTICPQAQKNIQELFLICQSASKGSSSLFSGPVPNPVVICQRCFLNFGVIEIN